MIEEKGEIIDIATFVDEFKNRFYRVTIECSKMPKLKLGDCKIVQKEK